VLKLADFGFAKKMVDGKVSGICGSYEYMAPEMLALRDYSTSYDVYSLGILLFELLVGRTPFRGATQKNIIPLINQGIEFPM
jgi:serine/threonine protein kinase